MPIPALNRHGLLPPGVHECTLEDIRNRFGVFRGSDRRPQLCARLERFVQAARRTGLVEALLVNGSFVTETPDPNDVDLVLVLAAGHDLRADLSPDEYNVVSRRQVRQRFGFDLVVVRAGTLEYGEAVAFFQQVRLRPGLSKGILRLQL